MKKWIRRISLRIPQATSVTFPVIFFCHRRVVERSPFGAMSRAFTPPDTLSKDEIRTIADVRRDIWTNAFYGLGTGSAAGVIMHTVAGLGNRYNLWKIPVSRNTLMACFMFGGALGSFVMAVTTGKNEVHNLHPIFEVGSKKPTSSYEEKLKDAKERAINFEISTQSGSDGSFTTQDLLQDGEVLDRVNREQNRIYRRATLTVRRNLREI